MNVYKLMENIHWWFKTLLKENYVGVYFHGSLRLGSFNPDKSDLDFIVVIRDKMKQKEKEQIRDIVLRNLSFFPKKGCEFSVVLEKNCKMIRYPTPYEMHFSGNKEKTNIIIDDNEKADPDLVSHFNVINVPNNLMDFGKNSKEVFPMVPGKYVIKSNYRDILDCSKNIFTDPTYCILNICRFYAFLKENVTLSKYDGGQWVLDHFKEDDNNIVRLAMKDYMEEEKEIFPKKQLKCFVIKWMNRIQKELNEGKLL